MNGFECPDYASASASVLNLGPSKECVNCGNTFIRPPGTGNVIWERRRHCSKACGYASMRRPAPPAIRPCAHCEQEFQPAIDAQLYCSRPCAALGRRRTPELKQCAHCGDMFARNPKRDDARWAARAYCSYACAITARREESERCDTVARGDKTYIGTPCRNGHPTGERQSYSGRCVECARERSRERSKIRVFRATGKTNADALKSGNPAAYRAAKVIKLAEKRASEGKFTIDDIRRIFCLQKEKCAYCKTSIKKTFDIDHIMPLSKGGTNWPKNIQLLCPSCNRRKSAKDPIKFMQEQGHLL